MQIYVSKYFQQKSEKNGEEMIEALAECLQKAEEAFYWSSCCNSCGDNPTAKYLKPLFCYTEKLIA